MDIVYILENYETGEFSVYKTYESAKNAAIEIYIKSMREYLKRLEDAEQGDYMTYKRIANGIIDDISIFSKHGYFEDVCSIYSAEVKD